MVTSMLERLKSDAKVFAEHTDAEKIPQIVSLIEKADSATSPIPSPLASSTTLPRMTAPRSSVRVYGSLRGLPSFTMAIA